MSLLTQTDCYFIALMELGWGAGFREVQAHVRSEPQLAAAVALAVSFGWFAAPRAREAWIDVRCLLKRSSVQH
jgi:hypothetical protein